MRFQLLLATSTLLALGCQGGPPPSAAAEPPPPEALAAVAPDDAAIMRTYEVPNGRAGELSSVLRSALQTGKDLPPRGTVRSLDDGRLLVVAPPSIHDGVAQLCREFEDGSDAPPPASIEVDYWIVEAGGEHEGATLPPELEAVAEEIRAQGDTSLTMFEQLELSSNANEHAQVEGRRARIEHTVSVLGDRVIADVEVDIQRSDSKLRTRLSVEPGKFVVLGRGGHHDPSVSEHSATSTLYYVVRARVVHH